MYDKKEMDETINSYFNSCSVENIYDIEEWLEDWEKHFTIYCELRKLDKKGDDAVLDFLWGEYYYACNDRDKAIPYYIKAIENGFEYRLAYYHLGESYIFNKEYKQAIKCFDHLIEEHYSIALHVKKACTYGFFQDYERLKETLEQMVATAEGDERAEGWQRKILMEFGLSGGEVDSVCVGEYKLEHVDIE